MSDKTSDKISDKRLLSCPFCGGEAMTTYNFTYGFIAFCCNDDDCFMNYNLVGFKTEEEAIAAWNTRKPMERIVKRLEEPNNYTIMCGKHFTTVERVIEIVKEEMEE